MTVLATDGRLAYAFGRPGPFVTVYLDATRSTENGPREIELRWRDLRAELRAEGADDETLDALEQAIGDDHGTPGRHGLVLVAAGGEVCLRDTLPHAPAQSTATVSALPRLLAYLANRAPDIPHVVVVADRTGADILSIDATGGAHQESVEGHAQYPVHRTAVDDWSERHFQKRVENSWESNAHDVADAVAAQVSAIAARLVVVAGDVRARHLIANELDGKPGVEIRTIEEGGRAAGSSTAALQQAVHDEVLRHSWRERHEVLAHLQQNLGRGRFAVGGTKAVTDALRMSQVDTVVLSDDPSSTLTAWVGTQLTEFGLDDSEAAAMGVTDIDHDRFDAALVRAVFGTGAELVITPGAHDYLPEGIGALLRFDTET